MTPREENMLLEKLRQKYVQQKVRSLLYTRDDKTGEELRLQLAETIDGIYFKDGKLLATTTTEAGQRRTLCEVDCRAGKPKREAIAEMTFMLEHLWSPCLVEAAKFGKVTAKMLPCIGYSFGYLKSYMRSFSNYWFTSR